MVDRPRHPWLPFIVLLSACSASPPGPNAPRERSGDAASVERSEPDTVAEEQDASLGDTSRPREGQGDAALDVSDAQADVQPADELPKDASQAPDSAPMIDAPLPEEADASDGGQGEGWEAPGVCTDYESPQSTGQLAPGLTEVSGLALSKESDTVLWVHNDSGDQARLYAIESSGERLMTLTLSETYAYDWEDMARGPCSAEAPESSCLYVGDIGDNHSSRAYLKIHRVPEPSLDMGDHSVAREDYDTMTVVYPDGARDCEALVVDEKGHIYLLTKEWDDTIFRLYGSPFMPGAELVPLQFLSEHDISELGGAVGLVTAASYSPELKRLLVRTYSEAIAYQLDEGATLVELAWAEATKVPTATEVQGEAIALGTSGYWHVSEGKGPPIWFVACQ